MQLQATHHYTPHHNTVPLSLQCWQKAAPIQMDIRKLCTLHSRCVQHPLIELVKVHLHFCGNG